MNVNYKVPTKMKRLTRWLSRPFNQNVKINNGSPIMIRIWRNIDCVICSGWRNYTIVGKIRLRVLISGEGRASGDYYDDATNATLHHDHLLAVSVALATAAVLLSAATYSTAFAFSTTSRLHRSRSGALYASSGALVEPTGGSALLLKVNYRLTFETKFYKLFQL